MSSNSVAQQSHSTGYQPSVPISVYRELASELQSTQAKLATLQAHNDQLVRQNQMLMQEFEAIAQSRQQMQEIVTQSSQKLQEAIAQSSQLAFRVLDTTKPRQSAVAQQTIAQTIAQPAVVQSVATQTVGQRMQEVVARAKAPAPQLVEFVDNPIPPQKPTPARQVITKEEPNYHSSSEEQSGGLTGWWLTLVIVAIVTTSFGAGYFLMRPFVSK